jgi:hypothetical protein
MADAAAMPYVKELADAIAIAFDDLRELDAPQEADDDGVVALATKRLGNVVGGAVGAVGQVARRVGRQVGGQVIDAAVAQVSRRVAPVRRRGAR